jgi:hypothetical protein
MAQPTITLTYSEAIEEIINHVLAFILPWESKHSPEVTHFFSLAPILMDNTLADLDELFSNIID